MFTHDYFLAEAQEFRRLLGCRSFWALAEEQQDGALRGLLEVYFHVEHESEEEEQKRRDIMAILQTDFSVRRSLVLLLGPFSPKATAPSPELENDR